MPITTDRRHLWRLAGFLSVCGTTRAHQDTATRLHVYLKSTCRHFWEPISPDYYYPHPVPGEPVYAHSVPGEPVTVLQCRYCAHVRDRHDHASRPLSGWEAPATDAGAATDKGARGAQPRGPR